MSLLTTRISCCIVSFAALLVLFPINSFGQIIWKTTLVEKSSDLTTNEVIIEFPFSNSGKTPIKILSAKPLCTCTTINDLKTTYLPGESGVLSAKFTVGQRTGLQEKYIDVRTDDASNKIQRLTFRVTLPQLATLLPNHLVWKMSTSQPLAEFMEMTIAQSDPVRILQATSSNKNFKVEVKTVKKGFKYQIVVIPFSLLAPLKSDITIRTDYPSAKPREFEGIAEITFTGQ